jgi:hypothetical protein
LIIHALACFARMGEEGPGAETGKNECPHATDF